MRHLTCLLLGICWARSCQSLSSSPTTGGITVRSKTSCQSFSVPLVRERPAPASFLATLNRLWNDPRPVTSLIGDAVQRRQEEENSIPYCLLSDEFLVQGQHKFEIILYPRGRFASASSSSSATTNHQSASATTTTTDPYAGVYLRYIPNEYGDEVDISWKLKLVDTRTDKALTIVTSGGLPLSQTTWSAAMTFCSEGEDVESVGRTADWGSSTWYSSQVCSSLGHLSAQGEITVHDSRRGETSFTIPPRGAIQATWKAATNVWTDNLNTERMFRVGEVIVPMENEETQTLLEERFVYPGTDYRIMTMAAKDGTAIFSSNDVPQEERKDIQLALRPCGWKVQQQLWKERGMHVEWPVQVEASLLNKSALTRFNVAATFPRVAALYQRDTTAVLLGVALALAPLPGALVARNVISLYAIPSASMDPTLQRGDVMLVEKFPRILDRTNRGDIVFFRPPKSLEEIIGQRTAAGGNSLFVKRVVGMPGDKNIVLDRESGEVTIGGQAAVGPDRNLCEDEPLRLIDRLLENGKGTNIQELEEGDFFVLGDCKDVSVDSRVFGVLPKQNIQGKPLGRIWPPGRVTFEPL